MSCFVPLASHLFTLANLGAAWSSTCKALTDFLSKSLLALGQTRPTHLGFLLPVQRRRRRSYRGLRPAGSTCWHLDRSFEQLTYVMWHSMRTNHDMKTRCKRRILAWCEQRCRELLKSCVSWKKKKKTVLEASPLPFDPSGKKNTLHSHWPYQHCYIYRCMPPALFLRSLVLYTVKVMWLFHPKKSVGPTPKFSGPPGADSNDNWSYLKVKSIKIKSECSSPAWDLHRFSPAYTHTHKFHLDNVPGDDTNK